MLSDLYITIPHVLYLMMLLIYLKINSKVAEHLTAITIDIRAANRAPLVT